MQAVEGPSKVRLPITINIMVKIKAILSYEPHKYQNIMMWAACCTAFLGFSSAASSQCQARMTTTHTPTCHTMM